MIKYICDRCGMECNSGSELHRVGIVCNGPAVGENPSELAIKDLDFCDWCFNQLRTEFLGVNPVIEPSKDLVDAVKDELAEDKLVAQKEETEEEEKKTSTKTRKKGAPFDYARATTMLECGASISDVAKELDISWNTAKKKLSDPYADKEFKEKRIDRGEVVALWQADWSLAEIMDEMKLRDVDAYIVLFEEGELPWIK